MPRHPPYALISLTIKKLISVFRLYLVLLCRHLGCLRLHHSSYAIVKELKIRPSDGGGERVRTDDLLRARQALSQLSYTP